MTASPELTPRQRAFAEGYARHGIAERAAIEAGYSRTTARAQSARLLANVGIANHIASLASRATDSAVADIAERRAFWTSIMRNPNAEVRDRLRASEILARAAGDFIAGDDTTTAPQQVVVTFVDEREARDVEDDY